MFSKLKLLAIAAAGAMLVPTVAYASRAAVPLADEGGTTEQGTYEMSVGGTQMTVDKSNLNLTVQKNGRVWYSGRRVEDDGLGDSSRTATKITDAVTVRYLSSATGSTPAPTENSISQRTMRTQIKFKEQPDGFSADINCRGVGISFTLDVKLYEDRLEVDVPYKSIKEDNSESYKLLYLLVYPYFDSSYGVLEDGGQIILPDGSGAAVDLSVPTSAKQEFTARVYGDDYGINATPLSSTSPERASLPMLALLYPDGGTLVTADGGAEYSTIKAGVSSMESGYNRAYFQWNYRSDYTKYYQSAGTEGLSYNDYQADKNVFDLKQTMYLLGADSNAADVAILYRGKLGLTQTVEKSEAGLRLQFLMSENKRGMFGDEVIAMSTTGFVDGVAQEVNAYCKNLSVSLLGYTQGGLNGSYPKNFPTEGKTGNKRSYGSLASSLSSRGIELSFVTDYVKAYTSASVKEKMYALNISTQFITLADTRSGSSASFRLLNPQDAMAAFLKDAGTIGGYGAAADMESAPYLLYSGYKNRNYDRTETIQVFKEGLINSGLKINMVKPNGYLYDICGAYLDTPMSSSGYLIETEHIPLVQMILSGYVPMYSEALNLAFTGDDMILRMIDFNIYPSFTVTDKDAMELYGTNSSGIFTSAYSLWKDKIQNIYTEVNAVLKDVAGCTVVDRVSPADGVYVTEYSNGVKVVVNYGNSPVEYGGVTVNAKSAAAVKS